MTSICAAALILSFAVSDARFTDAKRFLPQTKPALTVLVRDMVDTDPKIRNIAKAETMRILDKAGIELRWIDANGSEDPHLPPEIKGHVTVIIAEHSPTGWTGADAMGFAPARTGPYMRAYIFTDLIKVFLNKLMIQDKTAFGIILGHAIAHELGHLVIPGDAHGNGIMRPQWAYQEWQQAQQGTFLFSPNHARMLRKALQSR